MRAFRVAYDGEPYHGFQRQPDVPTVEDALLTALRDLGVLGSGRDTPRGYAAAGRTDAGVSAVAQTVAFGAPDWLTPRAFNAELPAEIRAWASASAPDGFHATRAAAWRAYRYHLHAPDLPVERAGEALADLTGTHDFHNLTARSGDDDTTRTIQSAGVERSGEFLVIDVCADGFLHEMVRRLVTLVADVAAGKRDGVARALGDDPLPGPEGIAPARPEPLVLTGVGYPDLAFEVDPDARESLRAVFERQRIRAQTTARVAETIRDGVDGDPV